MRIVSYGGFGTAASLSLTGRVLEGSLPLPDEVGASAWNNFLAIFRQIESDELCGMLVRAEFAGELWETLTDGEGYFEFALRPQQPVDPAQTWHRVTLACENPMEPERGIATATDYLLTPPPKCRFGVISDVDDTILWSYATAPLRAAMELLLKNALTREAIPGAPEFYRALQAGAGADENPIFYVSLSPWNLYELLSAFLRRHDFPEGPLLLRDLGIQSIYTLNQAGLKVPIIRRLLETYPELPFVLSGDSGQHDPETYHSIVQEYPGRIQAIYIRDVTGDERRAEVEAIGREVQKLGVTLTFSADTEDFRVDAARRGLIRATTAPAEAPDPLQ
jgi:phosphatidate phosphatase APP1